MLNIHILYTIINAACSCLHKIPDIVCHRSYHHTPELLFRWKGNISFLVQIAVITLDTCYSRAYLHTRYTTCHFTHEMIFRKATVLLVLTTKPTAANRKHKKHIKTKYWNTRQANTQKPKRTYQHLNWQMLVNLQELLIWVSTLEMTGNGFSDSQSFPLPCSLFPWLPICIRNIVTHYHSHDSIHIPSHSYFICHEEKNHKYYKMKITQFHTQTAKQLNSTSTDIKSLLPKNTLSMSPANC